MRRILTGWKYWLAAILCALVAVPALALAQAAVTTAPAAPSGPVWNIAVAVLSFAGMYVSQYIKKGWSWLDNVAVAKYPIIAVFLPVITGQIFAALANAIGWIPSTTNIGDWNPQIVTGLLVAAASVGWHQLAQSVGPLGRLVNAGTTPSPASAPAGPALTKSAP